MYQDKEINALSDVYESLKGLNHAQIKRIIDWVTSKFGLDDRSGVTDIQPGSVEPIVSEVVEPVKKRRGRRPKGFRPDVEEPQPQVVPPVRKGLMKYETLEELFSGSTVKTVVAKILLAAAFLQENKNKKELSSYDISSSLKASGQPLKNASIGINSLMSRKPPLLIQTGTFGDSKQSRRKFRVTEEGLRIARNYIK
ncbi:MAG: hypothetical protein JSV88_20995 [Candidatus Aminicenantes bacterium]|nr:MAG: hypothetical protein JSV88_20995 [Candidatus Aminicenantes bacterium]